MLNSPIRTFEEPADDIAPLPSSEEIKVKYPLLYKAEKDGKTHYLLGTCHIAALDHMPKYIFDIINICDILLTEALAFLSEKAKNELIADGPFYENVNFIDFLDEKHREYFVEDITAFLKTLSIEKTNLNSFSAIFLKTIFISHILQGSDYRKLKMDQELISLFKNRGKKVIELDVGNCEQVIDECILGEETLKKTDLETIKEIFSENVPSINAYYAFPDNRTIRNNSDYKKILHHFLKNDLEDITLREHLKKIGFLKIDEELKELNIIRAKKFIECHNQGANNMFMACGFCHFITSPEADDPRDSIKTLLELEGFKVSRITQEDVSFELNSKMMEEATHSSHTFIPQYTHYQPDPTEEKLFCPPQKNFSPLQQW